MPLTFCPNCSNALTISRAEPTTRHPLGVNRFECRTCPYQYALDQSWFEKTPMKQKEVEDVFGGKEEFANADSMASKSPSLEGALFHPTVVGINLGLGAWG
ncbi:RNA polymerase III C11 subunit [Aspergillus brasiliensis]|uniref:RNA polymerase III C11 subunit n=1 Tax=Aspergillus brasiliensis TaxID=319629 RepID=A0A9W5YWM9_9EURO|nr:RNA polymerase III C11 subunit [Aspergillus brasiliensis]GKZ35661.1 RNA polymerase III C11 subunit [Aspergillus brasiliensis]GKZ48612.1 RNA polymerase III C11 subunit [Aspergillus brasiliensis]